MTAAFFGELRQAVHWQIPALVSVVLLFLVFGMMAVVVEGDVADVSPIDMWLAMLLGALAGGLIGRTRLRPWAAFLLMSITGLCAALLWAGGLGAPLAGFLAEGSAAAWIAVRDWLSSFDLATWLSARQTVEPDFARLASAWNDFALAAGPRLQGAAVWLLLQIQGKPTYNPIGAGVFWMLLLWTLAGWAAWWILRGRNALAGLLPLIFTAAGIVSFANGDWLPLVLMLVAALFLVAWLQFHLRMEKWQRSSLGYSEESRSDLALAALVTITLIVTLAFFAATAPVEQWSQRLREVYRPRSEAVQGVGEALGIQQQLDEGQASAPPGGVLPRSHLLGAGPELLMTEVMFIQTDDPPPSSVGQPASNYYWRGQVFDEYTGQGWKTSPLISEDLRRSQAISSVDLPYHQELIQQVHLLDPAGGQVYFMGVLEQINRPAVLSRRETPPGEGIDLFTALSSARDYRAASQRLIAGEDELRQASGRAPAWILQRYLQLPEGIPQRVLDLADELSENAPTAYDRALALESYLRKFPYTLEVGAPPAGRDVADYFLFDLRQGYCDYYATAMTVLARAAGLPARFVVGYAQGSYDAGRAGYLVRALDAHAWVEIYFDGVGWVTFEPTAGLPAIERPPTTAPPAPQSGSTLGERPAMDLAWLRTFAAGALLTLAAGLLAGQAWLGWERWRLGRIPPEAALVRMYAGMCRAGRRLNVVHMAGDTPFEYSAALTQRLAGLESGRTWIASIQPAREQMAELTALYSQAVYSPDPPRPERVGRAVKGWQGMRFKLLASWLASLRPGRARRRHPF